MGKYASDQKFDFRVESLKKKWPKGTLPNDKADEAISYIDIACIRSSARRKNMGSHQKI